MEKNYIFVVRWIGSKFKSRDKNRDWIPNKEYMRNEKWRLHPTNHQLSDIHDTLNIS